MSKPSNSDLLKTLTRQEATVLYWKCYGWRYAKIAVKLGYGEDRIAQIMSSVYKKLGFRKDMHWTERTKLLNQTFCPEFKTLINGEYANIGNWPLYGRGITEEVGQEEPTADLEIAALVLYDEARLVATEKEVVEGEVVDEPIVIRRAQPIRRISTGTVVAGVSGTALLCIGTICIGGVLLYLLTRPRSAPTPPVVISTEIIQIQPTAALQAPVVPETPLETQVPTLAPMPPQASSPLVPPADGILFQDNFDKGLDPKWQQISGSWITANGRLTIVFEEYQTMWLRLDAPQWRNYRVQADLDRSVGEIYIAVRDQSLAYRFGFNGLNCWTHVENQNADCVVGEADRVGAKMNLELDISNNEYVAKLNGIETQRLTLDGQTEGGVSIGVWCESGFPCPSLDNFKVTYLP